MDISTYAIIYLATQMDPGLMQQILKNQYKILKILKKVQFSVLAILYNIYNSTLHYMVEPYPHIIHAVGEVCGRWTC